MSNLLCLMLFCFSKQHQAQLEVPGEQSTELADPSSQLPQCGAKQIRPKHAAATHP